MTEPIEYRSDGPVHQWFSLSRANYLVLPRSLMSAMPLEWQERMTACLQEMREACAPLSLNDRYIVTLRDARGRITGDPYSNYRHPKITHLPEQREEIEP